jgi:hypothetical protein
MMTILTMITLSEQRAGVSADGAGAGGGGAR